MAKNKNQSISKQGHSFVAHNWEGSIPHPNDLQKYEELCPGATDRLIKIVENEQKNVFELNSRFLSLQEKAIEKGAFQTTVWQLVVFLLAISPILASIKIAEFDLLLSRVSGIVGILSTIYFVFKNAKK